MYAMPYIYRNKPDESSGPIPRNDRPGKYFPGHFTMNDPHGKPTRRGLDTRTGFPTQCPGELKRMQEQWGALSAENFASAAESLPV